MNTLSESIHTVLDMARNELEALFAHGRDDEDTLAQAHACAQAFDMAEPFLRALAQAHAAREIERELLAAYNEQSEECDPEHVPVRSLDAPGVIHWRDVGNSAELWQALATFKETAP